MIEASTRSEAEQQTLPPPAIDPEDVIALVPGTTPEDALRCAQLATMLLESALYPADVPAPLPPPMYQATLSAAARLAGAQPAAGQIVSESLGAYSYRLASPVSPDAAFAFTDAELELLLPWLGDARVYELHVGGYAGAWPIDWWQRDLDNAVALSDAALEEQTT